MELIDVLNAVVEILRTSEIESNDVSDEELRALASSIESDLLFEHFGNELALNSLYRLVPDACRLVGLPDEYYSFVSLPVFEAVEELSAGALSVDDIDGFDDEDTWRAEFKLNGRAESMILANKDVAGPVTFFEAIASSAVGVRNPQLRKNFLVTFAIWDIYEEQGAALICYLPEEVASQIRAVIAD